MYTIFRHFSEVKFHIFFLFHVCSLSNEIVFLVDVLRKKGAGFGQLVAIFLLSTYYASIMSLIGRYLWDSFKSPLPWTLCKENWANCIDPSGKINAGNLSEKLFSVTKTSYALNGNSSTKLISSSEYYFR